jgi:hypothetical protein
MIFGTQDSFGIECHIRSSQPRLITGDLWLWAKRLRIGDEISGVELPLILSRLSGPLRLKDRRHSDFFDPMTKEQIVDFFFKLTFTEDRITDDMMGIGFLFYRHLVISAHSLEGFDSVFLLLLGRNDGKDRLIWKHRIDDSVHEMLLEPGEYDSCVLSCIDWVHNQTGYQSWERKWLALQDSEREALRRAILLQHPDLGQPDQQELLDQFAMEQLNRKNL